MSQISQKSITGITSITTPVGIDDVFTVHSGDTTERFRVDRVGNQNISGIVTATNFKTGSSNLHSTGLTVGDTFVHATGVNGSSMDVDDFISVGSNIHLGNAGVITATSFSGDGSNLTSLPAGLGTALSSTQTDPLNKLYYTNQVLGVGATVTVDPPASASKAYTQYADIKVDSDADLIIAEGDDLIPDVLGLADFGTFGGGASAGRIRVNSITNAAANGATTIQNGVVISGVTTSIQHQATNINVTGVVTATSFVGSGANLTSLPAQATIANNADNRIITGGSGVNLNGESNLTFDGDDLLLKSSTDGRRISFATDGTSHYMKYDNTLSGIILNGYGGIAFETNGTNERARITSGGKIGINATSPSAYARVHIEDANGVLIAGDTQARILLRDNGGGTNEKMMDIQCDSGSVSFRTIADNYTTVTSRATFRADGNFVVGNRVGLSAPSTNQPVAFHSARVTPDTASSTVSDAVRCNLYVGSNSGWAAGDGGVIGMGGSRSGGAGQEAMWAYIKGSRQSGNGWEYAGRMELGTAEWGTYNTTKAVTIYADNQFSLHGKDNTMMTFNIGGALRLLIEHTGGGNMRLRNHSSGSVTYSTSSDYRLKENATTINNALTTVKALKPYQFTWKHDNKLGQGFFAHEAQAVLPDIGVVSGTKDEVQLEDDTKHDGQWKKDDPIYQSVDYSKLVPLLTAALQEETAKREALEARVAALEGS